MRNLLQFIVKNSHFLLFLLLEIVAFLLIITRQAYPRSTAMTAANTLSAGMNGSADYVAEYFGLRGDNRQLNEEVCLLQAEVQRLTNLLEGQTERDTSEAVYDYSHLCFRQIPAKVIDLTTHQEHNYLTLNKGRRDSIAVGQGVIAGNKVVGIVSSVNERFALVVPVIHTGTHLSSRIAKNGYIGFTCWSGVDSRYARLTEIGRHIEVVPGDSVVTSGLTATFPEGLLIGIIERADLSDGDDYYRIRMRLATDFKRLRYVQVLVNPMGDEMQNLSQR